MKNNARNIKINISNEEQCKKYQNKYLKGIRIYLMKTMQKMSKKIEKNILIIFNAGYQINFLKKNYI